MHHPPVTNLVATTAIQAYAVPAAGANVTVYTPTPTLSSSTAVTAIVVR
jgi:hypothetical protein